MRLRVLAVLAGLSCLASGCQGPRTVSRSLTDAELFAPVSMRIHPIFSNVKDWTGDGHPDGIEALLEFQDQFSDPTKSAGTVVFELYTYRPFSPDPRGQRTVNPWVGSLQTLREQQARWNRTSRTYSFQLEFPAIRRDESYVLAATFDTGTMRFFDEIVLQGENAPRVRPAAGRDASAVPATQPQAPQPQAPQPNAPGARDATAAP